jgi:deoxyribose-phosphate aldolase
MPNMPATSFEHKSRDCTQSTGSCTNCGLCVVKKPQAVDNIISFGASRIGANAGISSQIDTKLASMIDHTLLKPDATQAELTKVCTEAREYHFATVCVNSSNIPFVARLLKGSSVKPIAVVGFPLGAATSQAKAFEAKEAIHSGAEEIDMVINIGALKSKDYKTVYEDIKQVVEASKPYAVKVILETSSLDHDEKVLACALSKTAGAAFVKTSTGFASGGATVEDIALMRKIVGENMHVKASGGIRTKEDAEKMVNAGADRIGASASVAIVTGKQTKTGGY